MPGSVTIGCTVGAGVPGTGNAACGHRRVGVQTATVQNVLARGVLHNPPPVAGSTPKNVAPVGTFMNCPLVPLVTYKTPSPESARTRRELLQLQLISRYHGLLGAVTVGEGVTEAVGATYAPGARRGVGSQSHSRRRGNTSALQAGDIFGHHAQNRGVDQLALESVIGP